jgi:hypothetical protein
MWGRREMHTDFWWGNLRETTWKACVCSWEDIKIHLKEIEWQDVIGFIRLTICTSDGLLQTW